MSHSRNLSEDGIASLPSQRAGRLQPVIENPAPFPTITSPAAFPPNGPLAPQQSPSRTVSPTPPAQAYTNINPVERTVSPEPFTQGPSSPINQLVTPTRVAEDNIYDATPRQSSFPIQQQQQQQQQPRVSPTTIVISGPTEPKSAGTSLDVTRPKQPIAEEIIIEPPPVTHSHPHRHHHHHHNHQTSDVDLDDCLLYTSPSPRDS